VRAADLAGHDVQVRVSWSDAIWRSHHGDRRELRLMNSQDTLGSALEAFIREHKARG